MKKILIVTIGIVLLLLVSLGSGSVSQAAFDATCSVTPSSGPTGSNFTVSCSGFTKNTQVWAYLVEPDGTAIVRTNPNNLPDESGLGGTYRTDGAGKVVFVIHGLERPTDPASAKMQLGNYTIVVQEGSGNNIVHMGQASFFVTGGTVGVSGATISFADSVLAKPGTTRLTGSGFGSKTHVTIWYDMPAECSGENQHVTLIGSPLSEIRYGFDGVYTTDTLGTITTKADGTFDVGVFFESLSCSGVWHFVAREVGGTGLGGETWITITGSSVVADASLTADASTVMAMNQVVNFSFSGFKAFEALTCWTTAPDGRVSNVPTNSLYGLPLPDAVPIRADAKGNGSFSFTTGNTGAGSIPFKQESEGPLGWWTITCRGNGSGSIAMFTYLVVGGPTDP